MRPCGTLAAASPGLLVALCPGRREGFGKGCGPCGAGWNTGPASQALPCPALSTLCCADGPRPSARQAGSPSAGGLVVFFGGRAICQLTTHRKWVLMTAAGPARAALSSPEAPFQPGWLLMSLSPRLSTPCSRSGCSDAWGCGVTSPRCRQECVTLWSGCDTQTRGWGCPAHTGPAASRSCLPCFLQEEKEGVPVSKGSLGPFGLPQMVTPPVGPPPCMGAGCGAVLCPWPTQGAGHTVVSSVSLMQKG